MSFEMTNHERTLAVIHLDHLTGEYVGEGQVLIASMTGLPAHCTQVKPPREKKNATRVFNGDSWNYVENHRGKTVYDKSTAFPFIVTALGPLPENMTEIAPDNAFSKWTGSSWETDVEAALQAETMDNNNKKIALAAEAARKMIPLQNAVKHDIATEEEQQLLAAWEKYTVLLNRVDTSDPIWPVVPADVA